MSPTAGFEYLLVFVDTFARWTEAIPTRIERAIGGQELLVAKVAKYLLKQTLLRLVYQEAHRVTVKPLL